MCGYLCLKGFKRFQTGLKRTSKGVLQDPLQGILRIPGLPFKVTFHTIKGLFDPSKRAKINSGGGGSTPTDFSGALSKFYA